MMAKEFAATEVKVIPSSMEEGRLQAQVFVNGVKLFSFYDDEIQISPDELIGKTKEECFNLFLEKDKAYLNS